MDVATRKLTPFNRKYFFPVFDMNGARRVLHRLQPSGRPVPFGANVSPNRSPGGLDFSCTTEKTSITRRLNSNAQMSHSICRDAALAPNGDATPFLFPRPIALTASTRSN